MSPVVITAVIIGAAVVIALLSMGMLPSDWLQGRIVRPRSIPQSLTPNFDQCSGITKLNCFAGSPECCSNGGQPYRTCTNAKTGASNCRSSTTSSTPQPPSSPRQGTTSQTNRCGPGFKEVGTITNQAGRCRVECEVEGQPGKTLEGYRGTRFVPC